MTVGVDTDFAMTGPDGAAIPGLCADGEAAGGAHGDSRLGDNSGEALEPNQLKKPANAVDVERHLAELHRSPARGLLAETVAIGTEEDPIVGRAAQ